MSLRTHTSPQTQVKQTNADGDSFESTLVPIKEFPLIITGQGDFRRVIYEPTLIDAIPGAAAPTSAPTTLPLGLILFCFLIGAAAMAVVALVLIPKH